MNELAARSQALRSRIESFVEQHKAARSKASVPALGSYPLPGLKRRIADALSARWGKGQLEPQIETIEREKFGGDLVVKIPQLLRDGGPKGFIANHLPWVVEILSGPDFADAIERVDAKGMYVNLTLTNRWLLNSAQATVDLGDAFGLNDSLSNSRVVVDYSSPNVAKVLHAGHIRSTIIGHVLSNLYESCGALV